MVYSEKTTAFQGCMFMVTGPSKKKKMFMVTGCVSFVGFTFAAVVSKLLPLSDNPIISAIQNDRYYCFLVPLTIPILVTAEYFHWLSMKMFKHA